MAAAQLRAPLFEDKVVDFLFSRAEVTDRTVSREELQAEIESEDGHVHGPGCGHDHADHAPAPKAKKAGGKKAKTEDAAPAEAPAPKKAAAKKSEAAAPVAEQAETPAPAKKAAPKKKAAAPAPAAEGAAEPAKKSRAKKSAE